MAADALATQSVAMLSTQFSRNDQCYGWCYTLFYKITVLFTNMKYQH